MNCPRHPVAAAEARALVNAYDGSAEEMVEEQLAHRLEDGDVQTALQLDQVRREIGRVYEREGK